MASKLAMLAKIADMKGRLKVRLYIYNALAHADGFLVF